MSSSPIVSIVLPAYNAEKYIREAVTSILNQSLDDLELIVVDDCSSDNTLSELNKIADKRLNIIRQSVNQGYPFAMNEGIAIARGKYIARMDADDFSEPDRLQKQYELHEKNPEVAFISSERYWLSPNGNRFTKSEVSYDQAFFEETWEQLMDGNRKFTDAASFILAERLRQVGGYRTYQSSGMDVDLWFRLMEHTGMHMLTITKPLYGRRLTPGAMTFKPETIINNQVPRLLAKERIEKGIDRIDAGLPLDEVRKKAKSVITDTVRLNEQTLRFLSTQAAHCLLAGDTRGAIAFLLKAQRRNLGPKRKNLWQHFLKRVVKGWIQQEIVRA